MNKKRIDILDILDPANIKIKEYTDQTIPFSNESWIDSSDQMIYEAARILPAQLSFIYCMLHEYPGLLPSERHPPGRIQELIYLDMMNNLESRSKRDFGLEKKITRLWVDNGGIKPGRKDRKNGKTQ